MIALLCAGPAFAFNLPSGALTRTSSKPLLDIGPPGSPDSNKTGPRVVLKLGATDYRMWYEAVPAANAASVGYATSTNGLDWVKQGVVLRPSAAWEGGTNGEVSPNSILLENGVFRMWYHSFDFSSSPRRRIGYASSTNGLNWVKHPTPVLDVGPSGAIDDKAVVEPRVLAVDGGYRMYYGAMSFATASAGYNLCLATSPDGTNWTKYPGNPLGGLPALTAAAGHAIIGDNGIWYMWHGQPAPDNYGGLYFAWSRDGISWTEGANNPVLSAKNPTPGAYDSEGAGDSISVYRDGTTYRILYTGLKGFDSTLGFWPERIMMATVATISDVAGASGDSDTDGFTNLSEFLAGTDPANNSSNLRVLSTSAEANGRRIVWRAGAGRTYMVQAANGPTGGFTDISPPIFISGSGDVITNFLDVSGTTNPTRFYRLRLVP